MLWREGQARWKVGPRLRAAFLGKERAHLVYRVGRALHPEMALSLAPSASSGLRVLLCAIWVSAMAAH